MLQEQIKPAFKTLPPPQQKTIIAAAIREAIENQARAGLTKFSQFIDPPASQWYRAQHLRTIASLLEQVERGEIRRLIVSVPPRHWKSSLASGKFPAWYLGKHPESAVIVASYAVSLAEKFSREVRDTITENPRYKQLFDIKIRKDSARVDDWLLRSGVRSSFRAVGVGGGITGHGANLIIIDDPIADYEAAQSQLQRDNLYEWYRQVLRTRLEPGGSIVLIQTRWHEDDLAGRLIEAERNEGGESWRVLNLPAIGEDGAPLWGERYDRVELDAIHASVGDYAWNALYQGQPVQPQGNLIKRDWFEYVPQLPVGARWQVRAWDCAFTEKETQKHDPDYTASIEGCLYGDVLYLGNPRVFRASIENLATEIITAKVVEPWVRYGMGKIAVRASIVKALTNAGVVIESYGKDESKEKLQRATAFINLAGTGRVKLVGDKAEWDTVMGQWTSFPTGAHDDAVDAASGVTFMLNMVFMAQPKAVKSPLDVAPYKFMETV